MKTDKRKRKLEEFYLSSFLVFR